MNFDQNIVLKHIIQLIVDKFNAENDLNKGNEKSFFEYYTVNKTNDQIIYHKTFVALLN